MENNVILYPWQIKTTRADHFGETSLGRNVNGNRDRVIIFRREFPMWTMLVLPITSFQGIGRDSDATVWIVVVRREPCALWSRSNLSIYAESIWRSFGRTIGFHCTKNYRSKRLEGESSLCMVLEESFQTSLNSARAELSDDSFLTWQLSWHSRKGIHPPSTNKQCKDQLDHCSYFYLWTRAKNKTKKIAKEAGGPNVNSTGSLRKLLGVPIRHRDSNPRPPPDLAWPVFRNTATLFIVVLNPHRRRVEKGSVNSARGPISIC